MTTVKGSRAHQGQAWIQTQIVDESVILRSAHLFWSTLSTEAFLLNTLQCTGNHVMNAHEQSRKDLSSDVYTMNCGFLSLYIEDFWSYRAVIVLQWKTNVCLILNIKYWICWLEFQGKNKCFWIEMRTEFPKISEWTSLYFCHVVLHLYCTSILNIDKLKPKCWSTLRNIENIQCLSIFDIQKYLISFSKFISTSRLLIYNFAFISNHFKIIRISILNYIEICFL